MEEFYMSTSNVSMKGESAELNSCEQLLKVIFDDAYLKHYNIEPVFCHRWIGADSNDPWPPVRWDGLGMRQKLERNTGGTFYFSVSSVRANKKGEYRNQQSQFQAFHVLMLDDIGTKADKNSLPPTYIIESSEGNYQYGYVLKKPIEDRLQANALINAAYGVHGDGGGKIINKYARLPAGINGKKNAQGEINRHKVKLISLDEKLKYTPEAIIDALDLLAENGSKLDLSSLSCANAQLPEIPAAEETLIVNHPVYKLIDKEGWLIGDVTKPGWVNIRCPEIGSHSSTSTESETALIVKEDGQVGFNCFHEHDHLKEQGLTKDQMFTSALQSADADILLKAAEYQSRLNEPEWLDLNRLDDEPDQNLPPLFRDFIYIDEMDQYYRLTDGASLTTAALNKIFIRSYPGNLGLPRASTAFHNDPRAIVVSGIGWMPIDERILNLNGRRYVNSYKGFQVDSVEGDVADYLILAEYIYGKHSDLVLDHMAFTVQHPGVKIRWQILTHGRARIGKSMTAAPFKQIFGQGAHGACKVIDPELLAAGWTGDAFFGAKVLVIEEVYQPQDKRFFNSIKSKLANSDVETLNMKGRSTVTQKNVTSQYLFSNHGDALHFDRTEDKLLVIESPPERIFGDTDKSTAFYTKLGTYIDSPEGASAVLNYLLNRDVKQFSYGNLPVRTQALERMCEDSRPDYQRAIQQIIEDGELPYKQMLFSEHENNSEILMFDDLRRLLKDRGYKFGDKGVSEALTSAGFIQLRGEEGKKKSKRVWSHKDSKLAAMSSSERYAEICRFFK
jgi:hypothetical protein